jgi:S1-C subfamily serine protease
MTEILKEISNGLAGIVEAVGPSIVRVEARRRMPASGIVWSSDGTVITADHTIEREDNIQVGLDDGRTAPAALIGRDATTDVAVIRVQAEGLRPPTWAGAPDVRVGHLVVALARPGRSVRARLGVMSAVGDQWRTPAGAQIDRYLEADVDFGPGFSGGPLVNIAGQAVGLNTAGLSRRRYVTVPADTLTRVVDTLLTHGRIRRGYLGIAAQPVRLPEAKESELGQRRGLMLISVEPGSPAERAGLHQGDILVTLDDAPAPHVSDIVALLGADRIGSAVRLKVIRAGAIQTVTATVGERG